MTRSTLLLLLLGIIIYSCAPDGSGGSTGNEETANDTITLHIEQDEGAGTISIFSSTESDPVVVQNAKKDFRPYLHPIKAPDGQGMLTEYSPDHHKHQTGLYWGFTRMNGRDYFHNPGEEYWRKVSDMVLQDTGKMVRWEMVYDLLDEKGEAILTETQNWSMVATGGKYFLELEWKGEAKQDITIGEYDYGGLFLRMPWQKDMEGEVVNAARQRDELAEGQRAMWVDVGMQVEGREDLAHVALFDHPKNTGFPQPWRVDHQMGVGPVRARLGDWTILKGETETILHQVVAYTGELNDVELTNTWEEYIESESRYSTTSLWQIAQREGRNAKFLTPQEAADTMTLKEGYNVNVWASEPMMSQPMAFCWDDQGRMWIAENLDYETRQDGFSNDGNSRILILEDTDRDGVADSRKIFMEGIPFPAALAVGFDGLFIGAPPHLLFVPDRNGDDKADMDDIEIRLTGWGIRDRHETLNSLHWGPDGWLYGCQGYATPSKVRKPAPGEARLYKHNDPFPEDLLEGEGVDINGGVWRYHPFKDKFEVVAHGFSNPWGIDYDAKGQFFISACVIPHLWHVVPGGIYHRQGGQHFNPYVYNDIKTIADHRHRSAHGGLRVYLSDAFPDEQYGRLFMANIHEHAVLSDVLEPKGSGFEGHHGEDFLLANNAQWVGFSMEVGPEGALYALDWHDADICGKEVLNKETGRIFRIAPKKSLAKNWEGRYSDLKKLPDDQLVELQTRKSSWHARRARGILQNRAVKGVLESDTHDRLRKIFQANSNPDWRLRGMWGLHVTDGFDEGQLIAALDDEDEYIRAWAIQLLCEDQSPSAEALSHFRDMASEDNSPVVRLYLASALQRMEHTNRWGILEPLLTHKEDALDHNVPKMIWYGTEPLVSGNPDRTMALAAKSEIPLISRFIARRTIDANAIASLIPRLPKRQTSQVPMLEGMRDGLEGRTDQATPESWNTVYAALQKSNDPKVKQLALEIAQQLGDTEAARQYLAVLEDKDQPLEERRKALNNLADQQREELVGKLPGLMEEEHLRSEAIRAMAAYDHRPFGKLLIDQFDQFTDAEQLVALHTLASRSDYGWMLTQALKDETIPKNNVPPYIARQLRRVVGSGFVEVWGPIDGLSSDQSEAYAKYRALLTDAAVSNGNTPNGRVIYKQTCGPCHKMYEEGGSIGPDITGSNRTNLDYLLSNVLNPNEEIPDDYKMVLITTRDGRTYSGNVATENERQLTLRVIGQDPVVINKSEIQSREVSPNSMMPPGLFNTLTDAEIIDLVAYLRTSEQVGLQ